MDVFIVVIIVVIVWTITVLNVQIFHFVITLLLLIFHHPWFAFIDRCHCSPAALKGKG